MSASYISSHIRSVAGEAAVLELTSGAGVTSKLLQTAARSTERESDTVTHAHCI